MITGPSPDDSTDDLALVSRALRNDEGAFRLLVERYEAAVATTVVGMLGPGDDADDVGQETFVRFYHALDKFRGEASVKSYLTRIAINLSLNALKRRRRLVERFVSRDQTGVSLGEPTMDGMGTIEARETERTVQQAIRQLSPKHRAVVVLRMIEGHSTKETAQILSIPQGTVLSRLARAMDALKTLLQPYVDDDEAQRP